MEKKRLHNSHACDTTSASCAACTARRRNTGIASQTADTFRRRPFNLDFGFDVIWFSFLCAARSRSLGISRVTFCLNFYCFVFAFLIAPANSGARNAYDGHANVCAFLSSQTFVSCIYLVNRWFGLRLFAFEWMKQLCGRRSIKSHFWRARWFPILN